MVDVLEGPLTHEQNEALYRNVGVGSVGVGSVGVGSVGVGSVGECSVHCFRTCPVVGGSVAKHSGLRRTAPQGAEVVLGAPWVGL